MILLPSIVADARRCYATENSQPVSLYILVWPMICSRAEMSGTFSRSSSSAITRSASCVERMRPTQSQTLSRRSSRVMGLVAEPLKPRHASLTVVPSFKWAVTVTTPGACSTSSTRIFRSISSMSGANRRASAALPVDGQVVDHGGGEAVALPEIQHGFNGGLHVHLGREPLHVEPGVYQAVGLAQPPG